MNCDQSPCAEIFILFFQHRTCYFTIVKIKEFSIYCEIECRSFSARCHLTNVLSCNYNAMVNSRLREGGGQPDFVWFSGICTYSLPLALPINKSTNKNTGHKLIIRKMVQDIKAFFHEWCSKTKVEPLFEVRPTGE